MGDKKLYYVTFQNFEGLWFAFYSWDGSKVNTGITPKFEKKPDVVNYLKKQAVAFYEDVVLMSLGTM